MKKFLFSILTCVILFPLMVSAKENDKVKVYIFEAGGCPYCEAEIEYLEGLEGYNKTFEVVREELYIDHVDWKQGADYELGVKVATAFQEKGFEDASYLGTPFVVISDLYAAASYSTALESVINEAYEKGDKDIVQCFADGNDDCLDHLKDVNASNSSSSNNTSIWVTIICTIIVITTYVIKSVKDKQDILNVIQNKK